MGEIKVDDFIKGILDIKIMREVKIIVDVNGLLVEVKWYKMIREDIRGFNELLKSKKSKENKCDVCILNLVYVLEFFLDILMIECCIYMVWW